MTYDIKTYDVMTYDVIIYDVMAYDVKAKTKCIDELGRHNIIYLYIVVISANFHFHTLRHVSHITYIIVSPLLPQLAP